MGQEPSFFGQSLQRQALFSFEVWNFPSETVCCRYASIETRVVGEARVLGWGYWEDSYHLKTSRLFVICQGPRNKVLAWREENRFN